MSKISTYINLLKTGTNKSVPNLPNKSNKSDASSMHITTPLDFSETRKLIDALKMGRGILVDFSKNHNSPQRMLDFLCGAAYALNGSVERIDATTYLITPKNIQIISAVK
ncbi:MAG: cell division protein SepF [Christensenellaceae bacterium]|jgi:cell division inhibitor SepF|nr:cell division protein SepF [Christensenellaceae bacterium]